MRRFGQVIGVDSTQIEEYKRYHAAIWPEISAAIHEAGIRNYSIFWKDDLLFAFFEYVGPEEEFDMRWEQMAAAPRMDEWWAIMKAMQRPIPTRAEGEWWADMEEVFRQD